MQVDIYIKFHFKGNPRGAGTAAAVVEFIDKYGKAHKRHQEIRTEQDTRNALQLKICIAAMRLLIKPCNVTIHTDNQYIENVYRSGWLYRWQHNGWKKADGKSPANVEDWKQFYILTKIHAITFVSYDSQHDEVLNKILGG